MTVFRMGRSPIPTKYQIIAFFELEARNAGVTQLVESLPSKQVVAGSSPVSRSSILVRSWWSVVGSKLGLNESKTSVNFC